MEKLERNAGLPSNTSRTSPLNLSKQDMIGQSQSILTLKSHIDAVASTDLSVLIMGETGVGKELVAHAIFRQSQRNKQPFVYLNCAALPESVAESELFGHIKGAFTGAISNRKGKFELANKGTLFLDEIGELSLTLQAKLLRALQYGDIQRVGDDSNIKVDVRIIAATNRVMHEEVKKGNMRSDLYHRLSVFPIFVPPLRERGDDVILLAGFFAERSSHKLNVASIQIDNSVLPLLHDHAWEGNVRELEHAIYRAAVIAKSESNEAHISIRPNHFHFQKESYQSEAISLSTQILPLSKQEQSITDLQTNELHDIVKEGGTLKEIMEQFQYQVVQKVYLENNKKLSITAKQLGMFPANLHRLLKRLNLNT